MPQISYNESVITAYVVSVTSSHCLRIIPEWSISYFASVPALSQDVYRGRCVHYARRYTLAQEFLACYHMYMHDIR